VTSSVPVIVTTVVPASPRPGLFEEWRATTTVGTVAACGFSGVLYKVITSDAVLSLIKAVISKAFKLSF
jgi:hypothetical protein